MNPHTLEVFFDGDCPLCNREIKWLRSRDKDRKILFTDLASEGFHPQELGKTKSELMARIHGRTASGHWIEGVDLFISLYELTRLGWISRTMGNRLLRPLFEVGYRFFAKHRLTLTGRRRCTTACALNSADKA